MARRQYRPLDMVLNKITNLARGTATTDAATTGQVIERTQWKGVYSVIGQLYEKNDMVLDDTWLMVANTTNSERPSPQPSGPDTDLLPLPTWNTLGAKADYQVENTWTMNASGWIEQYSVDVPVASADQTYTMSLYLNGSLRSTYSFTPTTAGLVSRSTQLWLVTGGTLVTVRLSVVDPKNGTRSWVEHANLFATAPPYCLSAQGKKDFNPTGNTAYGCHVRFTPGTKSPSWDVAAHSVGGSGGGGGGGSAPPGVIAPFAGTVAPDGWAMCDGTAHNSATLKTMLGSDYTPDLRGLFIVGAGLNVDSATGALTNYPLGTGSKLGRESITLSATQSGLPGHGHTAASGGFSSNHQHIVDPPNTNSGTVSADHAHGFGTGYMNQSNPHSHDDYTKEGVTTGDSEFWMDTADQDTGNINRWSTINPTNTDINHTHSGSTGGINTNHVHGVDIGAFWSDAANADHTHAITVNAVAAAGASASHENRPPYYAANYIIKK